MHGLISKVKRFASWLLALALLVGCFATVRHHQDTLRHGSFTSGYFLSAAVLFLTAFHWRKKLSFLVIGSAALWMRLHLAVGVLAIAIFALHTGLRWPTGGLETTLFLLFVSVSTSGIFGLYLTRMLPKKLSKLREEIIYERIPGFRRQVMRQAHQVVVGLLEQAPAETVADFYTDQLTAYFVRRRSWWYYLRPTSGLRNSLRNQLGRLDRYCSQPEREATEQLGRLIDQRDDLDYHAALQGKLKYWLFAHIGLTYSLVLIAVLHAVIAHAFFGGAT